MQAYDKVIVDEAQDMNRAQLLLAELLLAPGGNMVFVGDSRQAIYGFRGADSGALGRMAEEKQAKRLPLNITYRCPKSVVRIANLWVSGFYAADSAPEGEVHENVTVPFMIEQAGPGDALLCRANAPLMSVCLKLIAAGKRAYMAGRDVGEKLLQVLRGAKGKQAWIDMADLLERLEVWAARESAKAERLTKRPKDLEAKLEQIQDILGIFQALAEGLENPEDIEAELRRIFQEPGITNKDFIMCSTVHRSKGLEFDNVFILQQGFNRPGAEEDNIRYVAVTRAKKRLYAVGFAFEGPDGPPKGAKPEGEGETPAPAGWDSVDTSTCEVIPLEVFDREGNLLAALTTSHLSAPESAYTTRIDGPHGQQAFIRFNCDLWPTVKAWYPGAERLLWDGMEVTPPLVGDGVRAL